MTGWTPLFQQIIGSSVWSSPDHVRIAWITILATADKNGIAPLTAGGLAALARLSREQAEDALLVLSSPDMDTLTQENEGRRIERVSGGWRILNWFSYREKAKAAIVKEYNREAQAKWREKHNTEPAPQKPPSEYHPEANAVLKYLATTSGRDFRGVDSNLKLISARLSEPDVTAEGVMKMIKRQCDLWLNDPKMAEFIRPTTLFGKEKFDGYYAARDLPVMQTRNQKPPNNEPLYPGAVPNNGF